jgi:hypothetical protein
LAKKEIQRKPEFILSLEICSSLKCKTIHSWQNRKSRVKREFQARFCGNVRVKLPCVTRLGASGHRHKNHSLVWKIEQFL